MNEKKNGETFILSSLGEMMFVNPDRLPSTLQEELTVLQEMLEIAAAGEGDENAPVPPAYGRTATPDIPRMEPDGDTSLTLRQDIAVSFGADITMLSPRKKEVYVTVPRVVKEAE